MELQSITKIFTNKIFRIPEYQRGYAWRQDKQETQLGDFWEDLINLSPDRRHYTGMITLKKVPRPKIQPDSEEFWLVKGDDYDVYHVVDGQQRLTTTIIFIQSLIEVLQENQTDKATEEIYLGSMNLKEIVRKYIAIVKPPEQLIRTYLFGYEKDNPSFQYLRHRILGEAGGGTIQETFYTLNLNNAKTFFKGQLTGLMQDAGESALKEIYNKITNNMCYNVYEITEDFDVHVAFETMNNRGKKLSDLELLKNRLIFLASIYPPEELAEDDRAALSRQINVVWKEVYHQLGRNKNRPLNDDELLRAHWIMYFKYSRTTGADYIKDLLQNTFHPKRIYEKAEVSVPLEEAIEVTAEDFTENDEVPPNLEEVSKYVSQLAPAFIKDYAISLQQFSVHWFNVNFPKFADQYGDEERIWLDRINRLGAGYFRPLMTSLFMHEDSPAKRVDVLKKIERFIFLVFRLSGYRGNFKSSEYYNAARHLFKKEKTSSDIITALENDTLTVLNPDGRLKFSTFFENIDSSFKNGNGFYGWGTLPYFLYEYELDLSQSRNQHKIEWNLFTTSLKDKTSIEHVYPQNDNEDCWKLPFSEFDEVQKKILKNTLGNLVPLSLAININLQNYCFDRKKAKGTDRNGYSNGSYSELEIANQDEWSALQIKERGLKLLKFMERRWAFALGDEADKIKLLHLEFLP